MVATTLLLMLKIISSHILAKLRKEFKNKKNLKTDSNFEESTPGKIRKHEEQKARLTGSLNNYSTLFMEYREI